MKTLHLLASLALGVGAASAQAGVSADEAATLKTTLTPTGAERAGNKDGSIPAWEGGHTAPIPGFVNGGKRPDPFAGDKPLFSVTAANVAQHADKLSEGSRLMFKRFADYRIDVYPTRRTFAAPAYIYERTARNAQAVSLVEGPGGPAPSGWAGGFPFPIPKNGAEVMFNHVLRWTGDAVKNTNRFYVVTAEGKTVLGAENEVENTSPANLPTPVGKDWDGFYQKGRVTTLAPTIAKGSASVIWGNVDPDKTLVWTYLTGQRRIRKLPNACCDTQAPNTSGALNFDELQVFDGSLKRYDWKLVGKRELYIPYNTNRSLLPREADFIKGRFLNPDHVRWELHRVWVVEATLKPGQRHVSPKAVFYVDEDSWIAVLGDRWDAQGQLAKSSWILPILAPDFPVLISYVFGSHDHLSGAWTPQNIVNDQASQFKRMAEGFPANRFSPDALEGEGIR